MLLTHLFLYLYINELENGTGNSGDCISHNKRYIILSCQHGDHVCITRCSVASHFLCGLEIVLFAYP